MRGQPGGAAPAALPRTFDPAVVRADFPLLRRPQGKPFAYLDSAATSQKPESVLAAMDHHYRHCNANIHRGIYAMAEEATAAYEDSRRRVAQLVNARSPREIVFTRNSTEALNLVAHAYGRWALQPGDAVVLTEMEHHSNLVPWQMLAREKGLELRFVPMTGSGELDLDALPGLLADGRAKLVGVVHISNVLGTVNPAAEIARLAHAAGAVVVLDASQSVPHCPVDVRALGCDFMAFTGHKMLGPTGIGVLWARRELLEAMPPFLGGGEMIREVHLTESKWNELPWKFEAGTMPIAEAVGLGAAVDYLERLGLDAVFAHDRALAAYAIERLREIPDLTVLGPAADRRGGVVAFTLADIHPHDIATVLDAEGVAVRAGHHCAMPLHEKLGIPASTRASFHCYSLEAEVDAMIAGLRRARSIFAR
ncbi:MAG: cysteine desulfurase [Candidatus Eisenbacteria bacterium RBG_16_71_46]|nr:MAG: cysteine desulfurase [Candidatus Eisenbacteria bacterium RBG_16_71_46]OGF21492.1 MAG: cysteine desulfurase [Candidatus Eisenbacteria bacterium RBG_19FT_COMBO_70_11]